MDEKKYSEGIDVHSEVKPELETLHLQQSGRKIILEEEKLLRKITDKKRGDKERTRDY